MCSSNRLDGCTPPGEKKGGGRQLCRRSEPMRKRNNLLYALKKKFRSFSRLCRFSEGGGALVTPSVNNARRRFRKNFRKPWVCVEKGFIQVLGEKGCNTEPGCLRIRGLGVSAKGGSWGHDHKHTPGRKKVLTVGQRTKAYLLVKNGESNASLRKVRKGRLHLTKGGKH